MSERMEHDPCLRTLGCIAGRNHAGVCTPHRNTPPGPAATGAVQERGETALVREIADDSDTAECSAYPNLGRCQHTRCILRDRNRLASENDRLRGALRERDAARERLSLPLPSELAASVSVLRSLIPFTARTENLNDAIDAVIRAAARAATEGRET